MANGRIQLIGGPKDYFWSYALGTLVVRFFGVFLVLSMLMIGMLSAGQLFIALEKRRTRLAAPIVSGPQTGACNPGQRRSTARMSSVRTGPGHGCRHCNGASSASGARNIP